MTEVLDQSEIDALLSAVEAGDVEEEENPTQVFSRHRRDRDVVEVRNFDFKRPERVSKDQMRALQSLHEGFARNFGAALSGFMRTIVESKVANCEQMTYAEFISALPNPTSFNLMETDELEGQMCLEISPLIIYPIIDRLLGGTNQDLFIPQRPMTLIETLLIGKVTDRALASLSEAWEGIQQLTFGISSTESNPQLVQIVPPNEVVIVIGFEIKMSSRAGTMNLCIPYNVIEPVIERLSAQNWFTSNKGEQAAESRDRLSGTLNDAVVSATGLLAETTMTLRDLASLSVGDLIVTERSAQSDVLLSIEGQKTYLASIGQHRGQRALRVKRAVGEGDRV